jgi:CHASE2 domain-containing sensor protein
MGMGVPAPAGRVLAAIAQAALVLAASSAIAIELTTSPSPLAAADGWIESVFFRFSSQARPPSDRIVIIGITEETIDQLPYRSPVDRGFLAKILEAMEAGQPRRLGSISSSISRPEPGKDQALRRVIV